jgi:CopG family nickel-responsive transcriptional regulator
MQRVTITLTDEILAELDRFMAQSHAQNRSEAIRDLVRRALLTRPDAPAAAPCLGILSFTVDQSIRNLGARLSQRRLNEHDQTLAALSVPLDHTTSLEIEVTRGTVGSVTTAAEAQFLERGVAHGALALVPVAQSDARHRHPEGPGQEHSHTTVQTSFSPAAPGFGPPPPYPAQLPAHVHWHGPGQAHSHGPGAGHDHGHGPDEDQGPDHQHDHGTSPFKPRR